MTSTVSTMKKDQGKMYGPPKLMRGLKLVDESAQKLQAMLRLETGSVPGQQIPDFTKTFERRDRKEFWDTKILAAATRDLSPDRARSTARSASTGTLRQPFGN